MPHQLIRILLLTEILNSFLLFNLYYRHSTLLILNDRVNVSNKFRFIVSIQMRTPLSFTALHWRLGYKKIMSHVATITRSDTN